MSFSSIRKLGSSCAAGVAGATVGSSMFMSELALEEALLVEREEYDLVNLPLILFNILQNINKNNKTRGTD